jgi:EAL domain-containing protein (putative c-di-GMP-specific phosphodiesterase class I)
VRLEPGIGAAWTLAGSGVTARALLDNAADACGQLQEADEPVLVRRLDRAPAGRLTGEDTEREVRRLLEDNAIEVWFQPQAELRSGRCHAAEALIRPPRRDDGSAIDPETLATLCEQRGLIRQLTTFTLHNALRHVATWRAAGLDLTIGVNLSAAALADAALPAMVSQSLEIWGVPAERLTLELTESALIRDDGAARSAMLQLHEIGCRLSIDDFGTGYSPFTYLRQFPLDELKIDRSFVKPLLQQSADRRIVEALIGLAHAFSLEVVAEGVEDEATAALLRELGCDVAQGWYLSKALPPSAFADWCRRHNEPVPAAADVA